jgi:sensor c-di-GMP phosphodiesterase-like protein
LLEVCYLIFCKLSSDPEWSKSCKSAILWIYPGKTNLLWLYANTQNEKNILSKVVRAVDQNDTLLAFQPIVKSAEPNLVFCFEALVRIREASGQIIPASKFMPLV